MFLLCQQVKFDYDHLQALKGNFLLEYEKVAKGGDRIALKRLKREWEISCAALEEKIDENQIALRDGMGKELELDYVGIFSKEGVASVEKGNQCYFIDKTGAPITAERFDYAGDFHEGVAIVRKDGQWYFIDKTGAPIIDEQFDYAGDFHEGVAKVRKGGQKYCINKEGVRMFKEI